MITVLNVAGARPNFMKIAPIHKAMVSSGRIRPVFVHTGQHYDDNMSQVFLDEFGLPRPDFELEVGSGTHAEQTGRIMIAIEPVIEKVQPDLVLVVGDVNSTIAAVLAAAKLGVRTAHVEAGLRSFDRTMPEEINRVLTDAIADVLFAPSADGVENLTREGVPEERIHLVGNVMIDTLDALAPRARESKIVSELGLQPGGYVVATLHRPSNVDAASPLDAAVRALEGSAALAPTVLVAHPRTSDRLEAFGLLDRLTAASVRVIPPLGYVDFLRLLTDAGAALTDSGGIQEETTVLGVPCVTMRTTTERPITVSDGMNRLVGTDPQVAVESIRGGLETPRRPRRPPLWDGHTAQRIAEVLMTSPLGALDQGHKTYLPRRWA